MCEMRELESLEEEMQRLVVQDESYWRQNDAKFRAVAQNVSYDQFEEIGMDHLCYHSVRHWFRGAQYCFFYLKSQNNFCSHLSLCDELKQMD